jgi:hypothetical protein
MVFPKITLPRRGAFLLCFFLCLVPLIVHAQNNLSNNQINDNTIINEKKDSKLLSKQYYGTNCLLPDITLTESDLENFINYCKKKWPWEKYRVTGILDDLSHTIESDESLTTFFDFLNAYRALFLHDSRSGSLAKRYGLNSTTELWDYYFTITQLLSLALIEEEEKKSVDEHIKDSKGAIRFMPRGMREVMQIYDQKTIDLYVSIMQDRLNKITAIWKCHSQPVFQDNYSLVKKYLNKINTKKIIIP